MRVEADGILSIELVSPDGAPLPEFTAGAHVDLQLPGGLVRSYSLVNPQHERGRYLVAIHRDPNSRGGSRWVHEQLRPGDPIEVSPPRNNFALVEDADEVVLIAGGIGVTPLYCMAQRLHALGRRWTLHYAVRSRPRAAWLEELTKLAGEGEGQLSLHVDDEHDGVPLAIDALVSTCARDAHLYCCGPAPMLQAFERATAGRPSGNVHVEWFAAKAAPAKTGGFEVMLARSGRSLKVTPGNTILETMLDAGIEVPYSCMQGVCGACEVTVIEGTPAHRDSVLSVQEQQAGRTMMICCSGSRSARLVLDL